MSRSAFLAALLLCGCSLGCSLALDTSSFRDIGVGPGADAGGLDGGAADAGGPDAVVALRVDAVAPEALLEGVGAEADVRGTAVFIAGEGLFVDAVRSDDLDVRGFRAAADGTALGVEVGVPVDTALGLDSNKTVTLELVRGGASTPVQLSVRGLDEGVLTPADPLPSGPSPTPYSRLVVQGDRFEGLTELRLYATARLEVRGGIRLDGLSDGRPGPGGCRGGGPEQGGECDARAGGAGATSTGLRPTGGGGAGNLGPGEPGGAFMEGLDPGRAGTATAGEAIVSGLRAQAGAGGGGGGDSASGGGGGGGGALALVSRGHLVLDDVDARGGPGAPLTGDCARAGGGGGSGGVLLVRGWRVQGEATLDVRGGAPGGVPGCDNRGGAGGRGFVYVASSSTAGSLVAEPASAARLAPAWAEGTPVIVTPQARLSVRGAGAFHLQVEGGTGRASIVPAGGVGAVDLDLGEPGLKQVCLRRRASAVDALEGRDCLVFAVVP